MIRDVDAVKMLMPMAIELVKDKTRRLSLGEKALEMAYPGATEKIADEILTMIPDK